MEEHHHPYIGRDPIILFLQDVADLPVITGKSDYLLLTRQVERARLLKRISADNSLHKLQKIRNILNKMLKEFNHECEQKGIPTLTSDDLNKDFLEFFENSTIRVPKILGKYTPYFKQASNLERIKEIIWRGLYLSSLIPQSIYHNPNHSPTEDELESFFEQIIENGKDAKQRLVEGTIRYVLKVARLYLDSGIEYLDLVQEGCIGLMRSVDTFSERLGSHFQSYAVNWIRQRISRYIADNSRLIRVPVHQEDEINTITQKRNAFIERSGYPPLDDELFAELGWLSQDEINLLKGTFVYENSIRRLRKRFGRESVVSYLIEKSPQRYDDDTIQRIVDIVEFEHTIPIEMLNIFYATSLITQREYQLMKGLIYEDIEQKTISQLHQKLRMAERKLNYYIIATATHISIESLEIHSPDVEESLLADDLLASEESVEEQVFQNILLTYLNDVLSLLTDRDKEIIQARFGLLDGQEKTLEEVGQIFGVTRERVRQIESRAMEHLGRKWQKTSYHHLRDFINDTENRITSELANLQVFLSRVFNNDQIFDHIDTDKEKKRLERLVEKYIMGGRRRFGGVRTSGERTKVYKYILENENRPLHHTEIYERSLALLPQHLHLTQKNAYATLFQNNLFRPFGNGVFGLSSWQNIAHNGGSEHIFIHCPTPLLPEAPQPRAFFESTLIGYQHIKTHHSITAKDFYNQMLQWAKKSSINVQEAQNAFDAWYACGLLERVDFMRDSSKPVISTFTTATQLRDIRQFCLNHLCQRILKMPEVLLALERITMPTIPLIQKAIFGSENSGFDVPIRLNLLMAFEAVSYTGNMWRITDLGQAVLKSNPPADLPDFDVLETAPEEDTNFELEDEFGLLDLY